VPRKSKPINPFNTMTDEARERIAKARARQKRQDEYDRRGADRMPRSDIPGPRPVHRRPELTRELAVQFVKILSAGVPAGDALVYFAPEHYGGLSDEQLAKWLRDWTTDDLVIRALNSINGGAWEDLDKDRRIEIGLDKAMASLAYFLYTHDYATCEGNDLKRHDAARKDIMEYLKARSIGDDDAPFMKAMREIVEGKLKVGMPPQLSAIPVPPHVKES
jgi:hypothetical protein